MMRTVLIITTKQTVEVMAALFFFGFPLDAADRPCGCGFLIRNVFRRLFCVGNGGWPSVSNGRVKTHTHIKPSGSALLNSNPSGFLFYRQHLLTASRTSRNDVKSFGQADSKSFISLLPGTVSVRVPAE